MEKQIKTLNVTFPLKYYKKMKKIKERMEESVTEGLSWEQAIYASFVYWDQPKVEHGKRKRSK